MLLTEYEHSHNEILKLSHRSSVLLARILLIFVSSSFRIIKKNTRPLPPLFISFSPSKNTEIIERRLQQIAWKCGKKSRVEGERGREKSFNTETEKDIIQRRVFKNSCLVFFFLRIGVVAFSLAFLRLLFLFSRGF